MTVTSPKVHTLLLCSVASWQSEDSGVQPKGPVLRTHEKVLHCLPHSSHLAQTGLSLGLLSARRVVGLLGPLKPLSLPSSTGNAW